jgi:hypothetical protein
LGGAAAPGLLHFETLARAGATLPRAGPDALSLFFLAIGAVFTYATAADFFNSTTFHLNDRRLRRTYGPLPWPGKMPDLDSAAIKQIFVASETTSRGYVLYHLCASLQDDTKVYLTKGWALDTLRFLEQNLEMLLKIEDAPVPGEHEEPTW